MSALRGPHEHMIRSSIVAAAAFALLACSKPEPPTITPKEAVVTGFRPAGVDMKVNVDVTNPNGFSIKGKNLDAKLQIASYQLGTVSNVGGFSVPAHGTGTFEVPLTLPWSDLSALGALAMSNGPMPYKVDGTMTVGNDTLSFDLPFHFEGQIPHEQIVKAAAASLPMIPGMAPMNAPR